MTVLNAHYLPFLAKLLVKLLVVSVPAIIWSIRVRRLKQKFSAVAGAAGITILRDHPTPTKLLGFEFDSLHVPLSLDFAFQKIDSHEEALAFAILGARVNRWGRLTYERHAAFWVSGLPVSFPRCLIRQRRRSQPEDRQLIADGVPSFDVKYEVECDDSLAYELFNSDVKCLLEGASFKVLLLEANTLFLLGSSNAPENLNLLPFAEQCQTFKTTLLGKLPHSVQTLAEGVIYHYGGSKQDYVVLAEEAFIRAQYGNAVAYYELAMEKGALSRDEEANFERAKKGKKRVGGGCPIG